MNRIRCAAYVRKSTERGLDQEFNSLDNQELACKAYIASQTFQGWEYCKTYADGGISGGTMARPALQEMLEDVRAGKVQIVLVYKIDRLSRSIYDFKRMMKEDFEPHECNLVSITQSFDTSTAMGKLTLNMLLSFAEFEREVASERIRDKMLASKRKGMWVGGMPPLGYDVVDRKLVPNQAEGPIVKEIFETYLSVPSLLELRKVLIEKGIRAKQWMTQKGQSKGGEELLVSMLRRMLANKLYIGKIPSLRTNEVFDGQHQAILDRDLFDMVQAKLEESNRRGDAPYRRGTPLLTDKIITPDGIILKNRKGNKGNKKHRYYKAGKVSLPAGDVELIVKDTMEKFLNSDMAAMGHAARLAFKQMTPCDDLIKAMVEKIVYHENRLTMFVPIADLGYLAPFKKLDYMNTAAEQMQDYYITDNKSHAVIEREIHIHKNITITHRYGGTGVSVFTKTENAGVLIRSLAMGWGFRKSYEQGTGIKEMARTENKHKRTIYKYMNLAYLSPCIINAVMNSEIPSHVNLQALFSIASKYENFSEQEKEFFGY